MQIENIATSVDQDTGLNYLLQQRLFCKCLQRNFCGKSFSDCWLLEYRIRIYHGGQKRRHRYTPFRVAIFFALIQFLFTLQRGKQRAEFTHGLGGAQEEKTTRIQSIMKERNHLLLQLTTHIDQEIATTDQVEF